VIRTPEAWREETDPLVQHIRSSPFTEVLVPDDDTSKTAD
jgi:hypothetical protein